MFMGGVTVPKKRAGLNTNTSTQPPTHRKTKNSLLRRQGRDTQHQGQRPPREHPLHASGLPPLRRPPPERSARLRLLRESTNLDAPVRRDHEDNHAWSPRFHQDTKSGASRVRVRGGHGPGRVVGAAGLPGVVLQTVQRHSEREDGRGEEQRGRTGKEEEKWFRDIVSRRGVEGHVRSDPWRICPGPGGRVCFGTKRSEIGRGASRSRSGRRQSCFVELQRFLFFTETVN
mmetsp:Transcript_29424/g.67112  ORF Transcript_29424/g.67112 Transcript_29424/m.67112 type:complete len:230 (-) Transcript_29424:197-886(-)